MPRDQLGMSQDEQQKTPRRAGSLLSTRVPIVLSCDMYTPLYTVHILQFTVIYGTVITHLSWEVPYIQRTLLDIQAGQLRKHECRPFWWSLLNETLIWDCFNSGLLRIFPKQQHVVFL